MFHFSIRACTQMGMYTNLPLSLYILLICIQYFFQYCYASRLRYILFHSVVHGFTAVGPYCQIKSLIVTDVVTR